MRLVTATGAQGRISQLWVAAAAVSSTSSTPPTIVLFHGDISETEERMWQDDFLRDWTDFSLERLSQRMAARYPSCHSVVANGMAWFEALAPGISLA